MSVRPPRLGDSSRTSSPQSGHTPTRLATRDSNSCSPSSPPCRRMRSDSRPAGSAPAAPSLAPSPRLDITSMAVLPRARSKPATQRRTVVPAPSTSRARTSASGDPATTLQSGDSRGRRRDKGDVPAAEASSASQRSRAGRASGGGVSSARRATPPAAAAVTTALGPRDLAQTVVRVRDGTAGERSRVGNAPAGTMSVPLATPLAPPPASGAPTSPLTSPTLLSVPASHRSGASASCTLPPMLSHARPFASGSSHGAAATSSSHRLSFSVPQVPANAAPPHRPHASPPVSALARFSPPALPPTLSPVEGPMASMASLGGAAPFRGGASFASTSTLTDPAITPQLTAGCLGSSLADSASDDSSGVPSRPLPTFTIATSSTRGSVTFVTEELAAVPAGAAPPVTAAAGGTDVSALADSPPTAAPAHRRSSAAAVEESRVAAEQLSAGQAGSGPVAVHRALAGSFSSSPAGSPTTAAAAAQSRRSTAAAAMAGSSPASMRPPQPREVSARSASVAVPAAASSSSPGSASPLPLRSRTAASPTLAAARDPHTPVSVSPHPLRPPRANGSTPRHVSVSTERRPLVGSPATGSSAGGGGTAAAAVRTPSRSPAATLSTEAAKRALKERRRRELYAWNEMLRQQNESGGQDAV